MGWCRPLFNFAARNGFVVAKDSRQHLHVRYVVAKNANARWQRQTSAILFWYSALIMLKVNKRPYLHFFVTYEWAQWARILHYATLERLARNKQSSLLSPFVSYEENEVLWISTIIFLKLSYSVLMLVALSSSYLLMPAALTLQDWNYLCLWWVRNFCNTCLGSLGS